MQNQLVISIGKCLMTNGFK